MIDIKTRVLFFDKSTCDTGCGIGLQIVSLQGATFDFALRLRTRCTYDQAECEAIWKGMELLLEDEVEVA